MRRGVHGICRVSDRLLAPGAHRMWGGPGVKQPTRRSVLSVVCRSPAAASPGELVNDEIPGPHLRATSQPRLWNQALGIHTVKNALSTLSKYTTNVDKDSILCICIALTCCHI